MAHKGSILLNKLFSVPKDKYIYYLLVRRNLKINEINTSFLMLSEQIFCTPKSISSAFLLFESNLLIDKKLNEGRKGRPTYAYRFPEEILQIENQSSLPLQKYIDDVLSLNSDKKKHSKLTNSNKLLVITLLANANKFGIVDSLSRKDLLSLTCMSEDKLKPQLSKLNRLGYINYKISGGSGKELFGVVKTYFSLNLNSNLYPESIVNITTLLFNTCKEFSSAETVPAYEFMIISHFIYNFIRLFQVNRPNSTKVGIRAVLRENSYLKINLDQKKLFSLFKFEPSMLEHLALKLLAMSSCLLSKSYSVIEGGHNDEEILNEMKDSLFSKQLLNRDETHQVKKHHIDELTQLLYDISLSFALMIKETLRGIDHIDFEQVNFHIHINKADRSGFSICIDSKESFKYLLIRTKLIRNVNKREQEISGTNLLNDYLFGIYSAEPSNEDLLLDVYYP